MTAVSIVSVIFPVYNVAPYVARALESLLQQSYDYLEIIIVDDKSTDNSMEIVEPICKFSHRNTQIIRHPQNRGLSAARNSGLAVAKGEYVYFFDSDDELPPRAIELLVDLAATNQADLAMGEVDEIGFTAPILGKLQESKTVLTRNAEVFKSFASGKLHVVAWNKLVRLSIIRSHNLYFKEGVVHEDLLWSFQLAMRLSSAVLCKESTYRYYANSQSITGVKKHRNFESYNLIFDDLCCSICKSEDGAWKKVAWRYYEFQRYAVLESLVASNLSEQEKRHYFYLLRSKKVATKFELLLSDTLDIKLKLKSLIMACPYPLARRLVGILHKGS